MVSACIIRFVYYHDFTLLYQYRKRLNFGFRFKVNMHHVVEFAINFHLSVYIWALYRVALHFCGL